MMGPGRLQLLKKGDPILSKVATPFTRDEILSPKTKYLVKHMLQMVQADKYGVRNLLWRIKTQVALSAPQIGISKQLFVVHAPADRIPEGVLPLPPIALFNPKMSVEGNSTLSWESCLSVGDYFGKVQRHDTVHARYLDGNAEEKMVKVTGLFAFIFQHEYDHLFGKLFTDIIKSEDIIKGDDFDTVVKEYSPSGTWNLVNK
jgi:peptide deformylase